MATQQTAVSILIGAEIGGTFNGAFSGANKQVSALGSVIKKLDNTSKNVDSYKKLRTETLQALGSWRTAETEIKRLSQAINANDKPSKELQNNFRKAQKEAHLAKQAYVQNKNALRDMGQSLKSAGVDTKKLTTEQAKLGQALEILSKRQQSLASIQAAQQSNLAKRAGYRAQAVDVLALGATLYGIVKPAIVFESAMADVKKIVDFKSPEDFRVMENDIKNLSKTIPLSLDGLAAIVAAGGQLGVAREHLTGFAETAAKMSVAMNMTTEEAGQSMAKLSNVLQLPINQMGKVGDVINHLSNNVAATAPEIVEVNLRAGAMAKSFGLAYNEVSALAGTFVAMGKSPEIAGTAINMMSSRLQLLPVATGKARKSFNQLGLSMKEYTKLIEAGKGQDAMLMVLEALGNIKGVKRAEIMKNIFGEEAQRHVNSLVESLDTYKANLRLVSDETQYAGSMQKEFAARSATTENNLQLLKNNVAILATNLGSVLLPTINAVFGIVGKSIGSLADLAEQYPLLTKCIGMATTSLLTFKLGAIGLGYGFTFIKGGVLSVISIFSQMRTVFSLIRLGLLGLLPVIKTVGMAFLTNPIGLIITGIALEAVLLIKYWKPISAFFKGLFEPVVQVFKQVWSWITNLWEKAQNIFQGIKEWAKDSVIGKAWNWAFSDNEEPVDGKSNAPQIGASVQTGGQSAANVASNIVEIPRSNMQKVNSSNVSISAPITINAAAGVNTEDIAVQIDCKLNEREREAQRRRRGANYD